METVKTTLYEVTSEAGKEHMIFAQYWTGESFPPESLILSGDVQFRPLPGHWFLTDGKVVAYFPMTYAVRVMNKE